MATTITRRSTPGTHARAAAVPGGAAYLTTAALAIVGGAASALTLFAPWLLRGNAAMNGSARGTALVALFVATPVLVVSAAAARAGVARAAVTWLGADAFLVYNAVLFLFATPFNRLFLLYTTMFALALWTALTLVHALDAERFAGRFSASLPARAIAAYIGLVAILNALAWLANVVPAVFSDRSPAFLEGTGLTTNPIYAQDLSFWIPLMAVTAVWLWRRRPWGIVAAGAILVFGIIESISIAVDQYMGHAADPSSTVVSEAVVLPFAVLAVIGLIPLCFYLRHLDRA